MKSKALAEVAETLDAPVPQNGCKWCEGVDDTTAMMQSAPGANDSEKVQNLCTCSEDCHVAWCGRGPSDAE